MSVIQLRACVCVCVCVLICWHGLDLDLAVKGGLTENKGLLILQQKDRSILLNFNVYSFFGQISHFMAETKCFSHVVMWG